MAQAAGQSTLLTLETEKIARSDTVSCESNAFEIPA